MKKFLLIPMILMALAPLSALDNGSQALPIKEYTLKNGLKVLFYEEHKSPVATFQVWYRCGSTGETPGKTGLAHMLEHMMFKGTHKIKPKEFSRIVQRNGGQDNAYTSNDHTVYHENFASDRLDLSLDLESDRMHNLILLQKEFDSEKLVVMEERRWRLDDDPVQLTI